MLFLLESISEYSSAVLTILLLFAGIYLTVKTGFFQIKGLCLSFKSVINSIKIKDKNSLKSMLLALGGTVGVGNIAGVGTAITLGGAGSVFWIWVCGFIGMITKYSEVYLAVKFKPLGPYEYIKRTFGVFGKSINYIFCIACVLSSLLIGNIIQSKAVIDTLGLAFNFDYSLCTAFIGIPVFILAFSDGEFIKKTSSFAVPFVSILYVLLTLIVILRHINYLPSVLQNIFVDAFSVKSSTAGVLGFFVSATVRQGISKGLFSHEAGQGSSPIAYSAEENADPHNSAILGILEVFIDTGIISSLTAFAMLTSGFWSENGMISAANMFINHFDKIGGILFAISIYLFCIAAISGWIFYAKRSINIICNNKIISFIYSLSLIFIIPFVALFPIDLLWQLSDILMLAMTLPNLVSVIKFKYIVIDSIRMCKNVRKSL